MRRRLFAAAVLLLLGVNCLSGLSKIMAFVHRFAGERQLASAELNEALASLEKAAAWEPGDSPTYVLIGRVIMHAQANGLPLEAFEGHGTLETFGVGFGSLAHGIFLNPADAWAWGNLASLYEGFRSSRVRLERMRRAGERATMSEGEAPKEIEEEQGLGAEDVLAAGAIMMARTLNPGFCYYSDALAKLYWDRGMIEDAGREIEASLALSPRLGAHPVLDLRGFCRDLGDWALRGIEQASSSEDESQETVRRSRAEMLVRLGRNEEAIIAYERLRDLGGAALEAECDLALGKLEQEQGRFRESIPRLKNIVDAAPGDPRSAPALYYLGIAYSRLEDGKTAEGYLRKYIAMKPDAIGGYWALADALESMGESDEAEAFYVAAVRRFPGTPAAYEKVIDHLSRHGKIREALAYAEGLGKVEPGRKRTEDLVQRLKALQSEEK